MLFFFKHNKDVSRTDWAAFNGMEPSDDVVNSFGDTGWPFMEPMHCSQTCNLVCQHALLCVGRG